jgi:hypothetical protein
VLEQDGLTVLWHRKIGPDQHVFHYALAETQRTLKELGYGHRKVTQKSRGAIMRCCKSEGRTNSNKEGLW